MSAFGGKADIASAAQNGLVRNSTSARGSNAFHLTGAALGVRVLAARALEGELITGIALVDVDDPEIGLQCPNISL